MPLNKAFLAELQYECGLTRKVLQRIPADQLSWKPHEKSMTLSRLATHIADIHGWPAFIIKGDMLDMAVTPLAPVPLDSLETLLESFEQKISNGIAVLESTTDDELEQPWTLRRGDHLVFTLSRKQVLRSMVINHIVHHRGQLTVYLRMLDAPVPSIYGPSADEKAF